MNKLEIKSAHYQGDRSISEIFIDDLPLSENPNIGDLISPFGWLKPDAEIWFAENFLLQKESELGNNRFQILVCSECADIGCGALTAEIIRTDRSYIWDKFGYQNNYEENIEFYKIGPFEFSAQEYESVFHGIINFNKTKRL